MEKINRRRPMGQISSYWASSKPREQAGKSSPVWHKLSDIQQVKAYADD
jgi:hypothetical protein